MKKNILMILLTVSFLATLYSCSISFDFYSIIILLSTGVLLFLTPNIDIKKHKYLWKSINIYAVSSIYMIIFILSCDYIDFNNIVGIVLILPGVLGLLFASMYAIKNTNQLLKNKNK